MRKIIPVAAAGVTALAVAGTTFAYAALNNDVTLAVDGQTQEVSTMSDTVGEVLASQDITVGEHDVVAPNLDAQVVDGTKIAVQYGRQVTVTVDGTKQTFWTTATNVDQALQNLQLDSTGADLSTSRSAGIGREGLDFTVNTVKSITVDAGGKEQKVKTTALTVGDALNDAGIAVDANDKVSAKESAKVVDGMSLTVVKVDIKTVTKTKKVAFRTVNKSTDSLAKGKTKVQTEGKAGKRTVVLTEVRHDGKLVKRTEESSKVVRKSVDRVVLVGTKEEAASVAGNSVWDRLAQCESGGNWSINTGNGFYGGLQFTASTWRAMGGTGLPHQHSRETQIAIAKKLQARAGWGQWPACTSKLGLR
ncbi:MAG: ubiquitin-like domain-containing protein [Microlunatus sp.]